MISPRTSPLFSYASDVFVDGQVSVPSAIKAMLFQVANADHYVMLVM